MSENKENLMNLEEFQRLRENRSWFEKRIAFIRYRIPSILSDWLYEVKWAYQRVVRGYDDRIHWGFDSYLDVIIPAIKQFCEDNLDNEYDEHRKIIFPKMLSLIKDWEDKDYGLDDWYIDDNSTARLWAYFGKHIGYFWN